MPRLLLVLEVSFEKRHGNSGIFDEILITLIAVAAVNVEWPFPFWRSRSQSLSVGQRTPLVSFALNEQHRCLSRSCGRKTRLQGIQPNPRHRRVSRIDHRQEQLTRNAQ